MLKTNGGENNEQHMIKLSLPVCRNCAFPLLLHGGCMLRYCSICRHSVAHQLERSPTPISSLFLSLLPYVKVLFVLAASFAAAVVLGIFFDCLSALVSYKHSPLCPCWALCPLFACPTRQWPSFCCWISLQRICPCIIFLLRYPLVAYHLRLHCPLIPPKLLLTLFVCMAVVQWNGCGDRDRKESKYK